MLTTFALTLSCNSDVDDEDSNVAEASSNTLTNNYSLETKDTIVHGRDIEIQIIEKELKRSIEDRESLGEEIAYLKKQINPWTLYLSIGSLVLAIIAIILHFILQKGLDEQDVINILHNSRTIDNLRNSVNRLENTPRPTKADTPQMSLNVLEFVNRISLLESQIKELQSRLTDESSSTRIDMNTSTIDSNQNTKTSAYNRIGYAKINTERFFTEIFDSNHEVCVFKIQFSSENVGSFNLISLDKIKSRNGWQKVVECTGVSIDTAKDFQLIEEGVCKKIDDATWEVTKLLKIKLK